VVADFFDLAFDVKVLKIGMFGYLWLWNVKRLRGKLLRFFIRFIMRLGRALKVYPRFRAGFWRRFMLEL